MIKLAGLVNTKNIIKEGKTTLPHISTITGTDTESKETIWVLKNDIEDMIYGEKLFYPKGTIIRRGAPKSVPTGFPITIEVHGHGMHTYCHKSDIEVKTLIQTTKIKIL